MGLEAVELKNPGPPTYKAINFPLLALIIAASPKPLLEFVPNATVTGSDQVFPPSVLLLATTSMLAARSPAPNLRLSVSTTSEPSAAVVMAGMR